MSVLLEKRANGVAVVTIMYGLWLLYRIAFGG